MAEDNYADSSEKQELINLVRKGDVKAIGKFLSRRDTTDLNWVHGSSRVSPLMIACLNGRIDVIRLLVEKGADVNFQSRDGWSALMKTVGSAGEVKVEVIELLMKLGAQVTDSNGGGGALTVACEKGDVERVSALLPEGAKSVIQLQKGLAFQSLGCSWYSQYSNSHHYFSYVACPVNVAVGHNHVKLVEWFLEGGVKVPAGALFLAVSRGCDHAMVKVLLDGGADVNETVNGGWSALMRASGSRSDLVRLLIDHGASLNLQDDEGCYALLNAVLESRFDIIKLLLQKGADCRLVTDDGKTALSTIQKQEPLWIWGVSAHFV